MCQFFPDKSHITNINFESYYSDHNKSSHHLLINLYFKRHLVKNRGEKTETEKGRRKAKVAQSYACCLKNILLYVYQCLCFTSTYLIEGFICLTQLVFKSYGADPTIKCLLSPINCTHGFTLPVCLFKI